MAIKFQFDSDIAVLGVGLMTLRRVPISCEIKE